MCCGKETYEEGKEARVGLTRRQVLKAMGVGTGLVALGGLTGCTQLFQFPARENSNGNLTALSARQVAKDIIQASGNQWKKVLKAVNHLEEVSKEELDKRVKKAKELTLNALDHLDQIGISSQIDQVIREAPEVVEFPEGFEDHFLNELKDVFWPKQIDAIKRDFPTSGKKEVLEPILKDGGWSRHWRRVIEGIDSDVSGASSLEIREEDLPVRAQTVCMWVCDAVAIAAGLLVCLILVTADGPEPGIGDVACYLGTAILGHLACRWICRDDGLAGLTFEWQRG